MGKGFFFGGGGGVKRPGGEAKYAFSSSTKAKKEWNNTSTPPVLLHGIQSDNLTCHFSNFLLRASKQIKRKSQNDTHTNVFFRLPPNSAPYRHQ